jgi:hypothetical protein
MPLECQGILLVNDWARAHFKGDRTVEGVSQARYEVRRIWASKMGITGIRVDTPPCVKKVILDRFGPGSSTFTAGKNTCPCGACETYRARTNEPGSPTALVLPAASKSVKLTHVCTVDAAAAPAATVLAFSGAAAQTPAAGAAAAPAASKRKREGTNDSA